MNRALLATALLVPSSICAADHVKVPYESTLQYAAKVAKVDARILIAICHEESSFRPLAVNKNDGNQLDKQQHKKVVSHGLCQMQLKTALFMDKVFHNQIKATEKRLYSPGVNAFYAAEYLRYQTVRYSGDNIRAIAAYNRGFSPAKITNNKSLKYVKDVLKYAVKH